jgi:hypothetical protein
MAIGGALAKWSFSLSLNLVSGCEPKLRIGLSLAGTPMKNFAKKSNCSPDGANPEGWGLTLADLFNPYQ